MTGCEKAAPALDEDTKATAEFDRLVAAVRKVVDQTAGKRLAEKERETLTATLVEARDVGVRLRELVDGLLANPPGSAGDLVEALLQVHGYIYDHFAMHSESMQELLPALRALDE